MSIGYIMIGSKGPVRSRVFYDAVMPHIGGDKIRFVSGATLAEEDGA